MHQSTFLNDAFNHAKDFTTEHGYNFIDVPMIVSGILQIDSPFSELFNPEDKEWLVNRLGEHISEFEKRDADPTTIPLTMEAGMLIGFGQQYALEIGDGELDVYHMMLAMFSYPNETARLFSRRGWIFENYLEALNTLADPYIEIDQLEIDLAPSITEPYSKLRKKFWADDYRKQIAEKLQREAYRLVRFGKYSGCIQVCTVILDLTPDWQYGHYLVMYCLGNEKRYGEAINRCLDHKLESDAALRLLAICFQHTGQYAKAIETYRAGSTMTADLHNGVGFALCDLKRYNEAIEEFDIAIALNPDDSFPQNNKGYALLKTGHPQQAKEAIQHALSLDRGNAYAYRNLALVLIEEKDKEAALTAINKAIYYHYHEKFGNDIDDILKAAEAL